MYIKQSHLLKQPDILFLQHQSHSNVSISHVSFIKVSVFIYMFSFSLTMCLDKEFSWVHVIFLPMSFTCLRWIMWAGEFISSVLVDRGDRVTSLKSDTLFFPGNNSFGCVDLTFFFFLTLIFSVRSVKTTRYIVQKKIPDF